MAKKKKLCIILPEHFSSNMGGAEYQVKLLLDFLIEENKYEIYYVCKNCNLNFVPIGYKILKINGQFGFIYFDTLYSSIKLYKILNNISPDIIYQNVGGSLTGVAAFYSKKAGKKLIWHVASDDDIEPEWKPLKIKIMFALERFFLNYGIKNANIIAAQTKHQAQLLKKNYDIECKNFIPIGHPFPEQELKKDSKIINIIWIANLKPLKQPQIFLRLAKAFQKIDNIKFLMIGKPGWGKWYDKFIHDLNALKNVQYLGEKTQNEVNFHLDQSHILVNTSRYEGFSNTFVQAWMREIPVTSLSVDPDNILVREGIGFRSGTLNNLIFDVERLVRNNELREAMGKNAKSYAFKNHSVDNMVQSAIKLFK